MEQTEYKPADERVGNLITLRYETADGETKEYKAVEVKKPEGGETPGQTPREFSIYPLGNIAECLDALEACGEYEEVRAAIVRKLRAWLGIPDYWKCAIEKEAAVRDLRARMDKWSETI